MHVFHYVILSKNVILVYLFLLFILAAGRTGFGSLLSLGHSSGKTDRIFMKGPGGRGEVEVAVSGVLGESTNAISSYINVAVWETFIWLK